MISSFTVSALTTKQHGNRSLALTDSLVHSQATWSAASWSAPSALRGQVYFWELHFLSRLYIELPPGEAKQTAPLGHNLLYNSSH